MIQSADHDDLFFDQYVGLIDPVPNATLDLVIVDGRARNVCGLCAMAKVKPGGLLLLDDSHRDRYARLRDALKSWERTDYRGVKFGGGGIAQTSTWRRPLE